MHTLRISFLLLFVALLTVPSGLAVASLKMGKSYFLPAEKIVQYVQYSKGRKAVFIYASWCPYCRQKFPAIVQIEKMRKGAVIPVSIDGNPKAFKRYLQSLKEFPFYTFVLNEKKHGELERSLGAPPRTGVPYVILLDENNKLYKAGNFDPDYIASYVLAK